MKPNLKSRPATRTVIGCDQTPYPARLRTCLGTRAPPTLWALGHLAILERPLLALFCSRACPGQLLLQTYDLAQKLRDANVPVIGGFHSPMEQQCLQTLLHSPYLVVICLARGLPKRLPPDWQRPLAEQRLLVLTAFPETIGRATQETAHRRNLVVAALADELFVAYAEPASHTEFLCREIIGWGKRLLTHPGAATANLQALGASVTLERLAQ